MERIPPASATTDRHLLRAVPYTVSPLAKDHLQPRPEWRLGSLSSSGSELSNLPAPDWAEWDTTFMPVPMPRALTTPFEAPRRVASGPTADPAPPASEASWRRAIGSLEQWVHELEKTPEKAGSQDALLQRQIAPRLFTARYEVSTAVASAPPSRMRRLLSVFMPRFSARPHGPGLQQVATALGIPETAQTLASRPGGHRGAERAQVVVSAYRLDDGSTVLAGVIHIGSTRPNAPESTRSTLPFLVGVQEGRLHLCGANGERPSPQERARVESFLVDAVRHGSGFS